MGTLIQSYWSCYTLRLIAERITRTIYSVISIDIHTCNIFLLQANLINNNIFAWNLINEAEAQDERGDRIFHERLNPFELPDRQFVKLFRLNKHTTEALIDIMNDYIPDPTRASALDVSTKVMFYFA